MKQKLLIFSALIMLLVSLSGCASTGPLIQVNTPVPNKPAATPPPGGVEIPAVNIQFAAPGPNPERNTRDARGEVAGIILGIWHGLISPITLIISFVNPQIQMYEVHNDGGPYDLGFLLGIILVWAFIGAGFGRRR